MKPESLPDQWRLGLRISHRAHYEAAKHYERLHLLLGVPTVVVSAVLSTTLFANLQASHVTWVKYTPGILSVAVVAMSSVQAFLRYSERSERHKTAAVQVGEVRRELEERLAFSSSKPLSEQVLDDLRKKWDATDRQAPAIPTFVYTKVERLVEREESKPTSPK